MTITQIMPMGPSSIVERYTLTKGDLTTAATTQTIDLRTLPKGHIVLGVRIKHSTAFSGGSISAMTVSVGAAAGTATTFAAAFDVFQAAADTTAAMTSGWKAATYASDTLQAKFTATSDNVNAATAGEVHIDVEMFFPSDLTATGPIGNSLSTGGYLS